jgi:hypothetical protein
MASTINGTSTGSGGLISTGDDSGILNIQTNETTAITVDASQAVTIQGLTVGKGAGAVATNTVVGASALPNNTTGNQGVFVGSGAGTSNTTGINNIGVGFRALYSGTTTGGQNVGVGSYALYGVTTGANNSGFGQETLQSNTTGSNNVAVGTNALNANTTGGANTAVGFQSGYSSTTGLYNTSIGVESLRASTTASYHTAVGYQAGYSSTTNQQNTLIGALAGTLVTGGDNTFIGTSCGSAMTTGSKNTIIGRYNGNLGGLDIRTASNYIVLSDGDGNPMLYFVGSSGELRVSTVYSLTTANAANVWVASDGSIRRSTSALKYKQDIRDVEDFDISALRPVRYKSKSEKDDQTKDHLGLIADEAAAAGFEELVTRGADGEVEGFQYERLTVVLLKSIQSLKAEFDAYKASHP